MPEQLMELLASLAYMNDLNMVIAWAVDDDIAGARNDETAMCRTKFRPGSTHI